MAEKIIFTQIDLSDLTETIKKCVREELNRNKPVIKEDELLKIKDAIKILGVSKVTLHKWRKKGILPYHRIASRIYFKKEELISALRSSNKLKSKS